MWVRRERKKKRKRVLYVWKSVDFYHNLIKILRDHLWSNFNKILVYFPNLFWLMLIVEIPTLLFTSDNYVLNKKYEYSWCRYCFREDNNMQPHYCWLLKFKWTRCLACGKFLLMSCLWRTWFSLFSWLFFFKAACFVFTLTKWYQSLNNYLANYLCGLKG